MSDKKKVLVIGAGPSGMMAAGFAAKAFANVTVLEKNNMVGKKLRITGKGRCNITNNCDNETFISSVVSNPKFIYSAINKFQTSDTIRFFEDLGLNLKTERGRRVFPQSDKAIDVVNTLKRFILESGCKVIKNKVASNLIIEKNKIRGVITQDGAEINADSVIIACGGMSYKKTGSNGDGYKLAMQAGHTIVKPTPSLVPLLSKDCFCKDLQGLSLKNVEVTLLEKQKPVFKDFGEMLFTHFGVSGPLILSASSHMKADKINNYTVKIDLKPALTFEQLDKRIQRDFSNNINKDFCNSLESLLPAKLIPIIIKRSKINPRKKCNVITKEERFNFVTLIKNFNIKIKSFAGIEEAIITRGGVKTSEINPKTMGSKLVKGLYFAGEIIDIDAYTGGYNLQLAFSTGYLAGVSSVI